MLHLHELGVVPSVNHHTVDPLSVPQLSSSQQDLVWAQWYSAAERVMTNVLFVTCSIK